jgi:hypothetical protein
MWLTPLSQVQRCELIPLIQAHVIVIAQSSSEMWFAYLNQVQRCDWCHWVQLRDVIDISELSSETWLTCRFKLTDVMDTAKSSSKIWLTPLSQAQWDCHRWVKLWDVIARDVIRICSMSQAHRYGWCRYAKLRDVIGPLSLDTAKSSSEIWLTCRIKLTDVLDTCE